MKLAIVNVEKLKHFVSIASVNLLIPILSVVQIVLVLRISGLNSWAVMVVGLSAGGIAQALIDRGYSNSGNRLLISHRNLYRLGVDSIRQRIPIFIILVFIAIIPFFTNSVTEYPVIFLAFLSMAIGGLSNDWILIGAKKSYALFISSSMTKLITAILGLTSYVISKSLLILLFVSCLGSILNLALGIKFLAKLKFFGINPQGKLLGKQDYAIRVTNDVLWLMPVTLINIFSPIAGPVFTLIDRTVKFPLMFTQTVTLYLTNYMLEDTSPFKHKFRKSVAVHLLTASVFSGTTFAVIPEVVEFLGSSNVYVTNLDALYVSLFAFFIILTRPLTQHYFILRNRQKVVIAINSMSIVISVVIFSFFDLSMTMLLLSQALIQALMLVLFALIYSHEVNRKLEPRDSCGL